MSAIDELVAGMKQGRKWDLMGNAEAVRGLLGRVYEERYHKGAHYRDRFQLRVNLQKDDDAASYAGWITSENPTSGPYQGTSFVWFPGTGGSVAVLVIGTDGFGADTAILGRPGHARRLRALSRLHRGKLWVKPDLLDIVSPRCRFRSLRPGREIRRAPQGVFAGDLRGRARSKTTRPRSGSRTSWTCSSTSTTRRSQVRQPAVETAPGDRWRDLPGSVSRRSARDPSRTTVRRSLTDLRARARPAWRSTIAKTDWLFYAGPVPRRADLRGLRGGPLPASYRARACVRGEGRGPAGGQRRGAGQGRARPGDRRDQPCRPRAGCSVRRSAL